MAWQPIETAPKDVDILIYCPEYKSVYIGQKCTGYDGEEEYEYFYVSHIGIIEPTRWQPCPEPPTGEE